jgi:hypothetical protein
MIENNRGRSIYLDTDFEVAAVAKPKQKRTKIALLAAQKLCAHEVDAQMTWRAFCFLRGRSFSFNKVVGRGS